MQIYLDLVIFLNFLVDFLLLLGTNRLTGFPPGWKRLLPAAGLGALYAGLCMLPGLRFLGGGPWPVVFLLLMAWIAFGSRGWQRLAVFVLLSMALGGVAMGLGQVNIPALILSAAGIWMLCRVGFGGRLGQAEYMPVLIPYGGKNLSLVALRDTGNTLRDPVTGESVLVLAGDAACRLTGLSPDQLRHPIETMTQAPMAGLRLIPYCSVGNGSGLMLGLRFHNVKIGSRTADPMVAFAPEGLGKNAAVQALTGGM